jgi:hypothetical protein
MIVRVLHPSEWSRVTGQLAQLLPLRTADDCKVLVVEDHGEIVGQWALVGFPHVEGIEIAETHRRQAAVGRNLLEGMRALCKAQGVTAVFTGAADPEVAELLDKIGAERVPIVLYRWEMGGDDASDTGDHHGGRGDRQRSDRQEKEQGTEGDGAAPDRPDEPSGSA